MVIRTARLWTKKATTSTLRAAKKNPIPKYMNDSIMNTASNPLNTRASHPRQFAQSFTSAGRLGQPASHPVLKPMAFISD
jgi:hypothetical protein